MYPKEITEKILELQAIGFSAQETLEHLKKYNNLSVNIDTIYRHRTNAVAQELIHEKIKQQDRRILKMEKINPALALKYANEELKILIPLLPEIMEKNQQINQTTNILVNGEKVELNVDISKTLAYYRDALEKSYRHNIRPDGVIEQVDTANSQITTT